jgi:hypothetical protein
MLRFPITAIFDADCVVAEKSRNGEIYHVVRNSAGGANLTPIARYFAWRPEFIEGYNAYWRVDCFVRQHKLAPDPALVGEALVEALIKAKLCEEPVWVSWHIGNEIGGKAFGEVFESE